jgi:diaminopimelate epimerase
MANSVAGASMKFAKAHAYGNDFLYVKAEDVGGAPPDALARELCNRHTGIGADGLIVYEAAADEVRMRLFNADGTRAEVSGNGVRALAALILQHAGGTGGEVAIRTEAGVKRVSRTGREGSRQFFRTAMGPPRDVRTAPAIEAAGEAIHAVVLDMGNPQCVILGPLPEQAAFLRIGAALERHSMFPDGTNVEFAEVEAPDRIRILIWERGVGPTSSSGTGSCAALVAAASFGGASRDAEVIAPGGAQRVEWRADGVYLTGWAEVLVEGEWLRQIPRTD